MLRKARKSRARETGFGRQSDSELRSIRSRLSPKAPETRDRQHCLRVDLRARRGSLHMREKGSLAGAATIVTGASSGIGCESAPRIDPAALYHFNVLSRRSALRPHAE